MPYAQSGVVELVCVTVLVEIRVAVVAAVLVTVEGGATIVEVTIMVAVVVIAGEVAA